MKQLLLIGFTKFMYMPYMNFYLDTLHSSPIEIHVIKWSRDHEPDISLGYDDIVVHDFKCVQLDETLKLGKIPSFLKFRSFVRKVLYDHCFDKIIVMHSLPAVLIVDSLRSRGVGVVGNCPACFAANILYVKLKRVYVINRKDLLQIVRFAQCVHDCNVSGLFYDSGSLRCQKRQCGGTGLCFVLLRRKTK